MISMTTKDTIVTQEKNKKYAQRLSDLDQAIKKRCAEIIKQQLAPLKIPKSLIDAGYIRLEYEVEYRYHEDRRHLSMNEPLPAKMDAYKHSLGEDEELNKLTKQHEDLKTESNKFARELSAVLASFRTHKPLVAAIPELAKYFAEKNPAELLPVPIETIKAVRSKLVRP